MSDKKLKKNDFNEEGKSCEQINKQRWTIQAEESRDNTCEAIKNATTPNLIFPSAHMKL